MNQAEKMSRKYCIDDSKMPVKLASALRCPAENYDNFDIRGPDLWLRVESDRAYAAEWEEGSPVQMESVIEAAETAGLGNCSGMLRDLQAGFVYRVLNLPEIKKLRRINRLETGAGVSTVVVYKYLIDKGYDIDHLFSTLIEPSRDRLYSTANQLKELGLEEGKHFVAIVGKDVEAPFYLQRTSQHIIDDNATEHHHGFIDSILKMKYNLLAPGGFFGSFEWREGWCEHPARIYQALKNHEFKDPVKWKTKEEDLKAYVEMFPKALGDYPKFSIPDEMAAKMIKTFWFDGWAVARAKRKLAATFKDRDDYFGHEAHRRPSVYERFVREAGFKTDTRNIRMLVNDMGFNGNPHQLLTAEEMVKLGMGKLYDDVPDEGSNILMAQIAQK